MSNTQVLLTAAGLVFTLIVTLWGLAERNTSRLVDQLDKRMNERDEKLVAKIDGLRNEMLARFETVQRQLDELQRQNTQRALIEKDVVTLTARVEMLERRAA